MDAGDFEGDELVLGRLREGAGGDAAVRQLRRRYDALRHDYEQLLDRLADIEDHLAPPPPAATPGAAASGVEPPPNIVEALAAPLTRLRSEYLAAATRIQAIVGGLERIAAGTVKGQHSPSRQAPPTPLEAENEPE